jgi:hypothetical protein
LLWTTYGSPNRKPVKTLNEVTVEVVKSFYNSDEVSRVMLGEKDCISIKVSGVKKHKQKRLLLCNLKELYSHFKNPHPGVKVGFMKFASLHPRNCIMAGTSGTHNVCVCTIHQNVKFMLEACKISNLIRSSEHHLSTDQHCLSNMICNPPQMNCFFCDCNESPGPTNLEDTLEDVFTDNAKENITFKQWILTDRCELVTIIKSTEKFIESFCLKTVTSNLSFIQCNTASYVHQRTEMQSTIR